MEAGRARGLSSHGREVEIRYPSFVCAQANEKLKAAAPKADEKLKAAASKKYYLPLSTKKLPKYLIG